MPNSDPRGRFVHPYFIRMGEYDSYCVDRYLEYAKDPKKVKSQDFFSVITYIASSPTGRNLAWNWVRMNWEYLLDR